MNSPSCIVTPIPGIGERCKYKGVVQPFATHSHDHYVIGLIEDGKRELVWNGKIVELAPGDLVVFNPGDVHACEQKDQSVFNYDSIVVDAELLDGARLSSPRVRCAETSEAFRDVVRAIEDGDEAKTHECLLHLSELLIDGEDEGFPAYANDGAAQRTLAHFCGHLAEPAKLSALASAEGISVYALIRAYRNRFFITPMRHLTSLRVECACRLLRSGVDVPTVAAEVGFADQAHLTRAFKQRTGTTPAAYQKMASKAGDDA